MAKRKNPLLRLDADLLTLRALLSVADKGSFSAAAHTIGRSQSAVSLKIAKLEDHMQVRLFERTSRSVKQTPAGEMFLAYARRIVELADEGFSAVTAPESSEPFRIGFAEYLVPQHLQRILSLFKRGQPSASIELHLGAGFELYQKLTSHGLDVVVAGPEADGGHHLLTEPLVWVGPKDREPDFSEGVGLVLMPPPCSYRQAAFDALTTAGISWHVAVNANSVQGVQSAIAAEFGVAVMARSAVNKHLNILTDSLPALPETTINAYWNRTDAHPLTQRFVSFLEEQLKTVGTN